MSRSEKMLKGMGDKLGLTDAGREFLIVSIDPFHDTPTNCTGIPNLQTGNSVTQTVKLATQISCPAGITDGTWDCYVYMMPWMTDEAQFRLFTQTVFDYSANACYTTNGTNSTRRVDPITILSGPTSTVVSSGWSDPFQSGTTGGTGFRQDWISLNENFTDGDYRVISQGFEVINTTPDLYAGGLCTTWRSPVPSMDTKTTYNHTLIKDPGPTAVVYGSCAASALVIERLPNSIAQALQMPDTRQWKAKDGAYVVGRFNNLDENTTQDHGWTQPIIAYTANETGTTFPAAVPIPNDFISNTILPTAYLPRPLAQRYVTWTNMDAGGAFFTGLSLQTTLTIKWTIVIERFPSQQQANLVVLAKPTPAYDPVALEMYKCIVQNLPTGVPQYENGLGDWFRDAVSTVAEVVSPVLSVIPHPYAQAASQVAKGFIKKEPMNNYDPKPSAKKEMALIKQEVKQEKKEIKKVKHAVKPQLRKKAGKKK